MGIRPKHAVLVVVCALNLSWAPRPIEEDFFVTLPEKKAPIPRPLPEGKQPGFVLRGTKGWLWRPEQYLAEVDTVAEYKMNFMMICYGSMFDIEHYSWSDPDCNRWWEPLPDEKKSGYDEVLRACRERSIELCLSMNPNLWSRRILDYDNPADIDALWQHYEWFQSRGMKWFCISLDDILRGIDAAGQAKLANAMFERLRGNDAEARLILCPTFYWGAGESADAKAYLEVLASDLHEEVFIFWTGDRVVTPVITREAAKAYRDRVKHRLIIWDNYPVNDAHPTLHLGPVTGRDADLCEVCYGYMSNPLHSENEINRIPLITCADYAYNPWEYDPARSIGQAIVHIAETDGQRQVLKDMVELYPGMLVYAKGTSWNPAVMRFNQLLDTPHSRNIATLYFKHVEDVSHRLAQAFPGRFKGAQVTLTKNIAAMRDAYAAHYGRPPE